MATGGEIIVGVLSSIVYDGLKRPYKGITDVLGRRRQITKALSQGNSSDSIDASDLRPSINELIRVIGNDHGQYSEKVAVFLKEVERSAIPDALKQFAMCGTDTSSAFPAFDLLYRSHEPLPFGSRALFEALSTAIKTRIDQSIGEKVLFEVLKAQNGDLAARIEGLGASLRDAASIDTPLPQEKFNDIWLKIARGTELANKQVNVETTQGARKVNVKKLVIPARLSPLENKEKIPAPHRDSANEKDTTQGYISFRRSFDRAVILGDPGGGKSTLTQLLCYDLANQIVLNAANPGAAGFDARDLRLPIRIILRALEKRQQQSPSYQIFDYLVDEIRIFADNNTQLATAFLKQALTLGQIVILFDGLDEILDVSSRRAMTVLIEQFCNAYSSCPNLITSRVVGYPDAPLSHDYQIYTLSRFNKDEVRKFSEQLIRAVTGEKLEAAKVKAEQFILQTQTAAGDLRENPLLLGLMVYIFNIRGDVPNNRPEIYKECSLLMFEKWDQRRDIIFELPTDFDMLDLFGYLASQIFGAAETEDGVSEEWLVGRLRTFFNSWYEDKARSVAAARILVDFITGRAWVMCEIGPGVYKFTHRTFLEYFFARRLEEEAGGVTSLIHHHLISKVSQSQWDVVSHLALQITTFRSGPKSVQALDALFKSASEVKFEPKEEINFLTFWARSLEYLTIPEARLREAIEYIFNRVLHLGSVYSLDAAEVLHDVLEASERRRGFVQNLISMHSKPILSGPSDDKRDFLAYLLGIRYSGHRSRRLAPYPMHLIWSAFEEARVTAKDDQWGRSQADVNEARSYLYIYRERFLDLYSVFGLSLIFAPYSQLVPTEIYRMPFSIIAEGLRVSTRRASSRFSEFTIENTEAAELLKVVTNDLLSASRDGNLEAIVFTGTSEIQRSLAYELIHYFDYIIMRRPAPRPSELQSRCIYMLTLMLWIQNRHLLPSSDAQEKISSSIRKRIAIMIVASKENEFATAASSLLDEIAFNET